MQFSLVLAAISSLLGQQTIATASKDSSNAADDKAAFLKRVADKEYLVHDLDGVRTEMHGGVVITYGRYVSLFMPRDRNGAPGQLNSIWFERVYAKRNGKWQFLSHRTVHGPTVSPAGVDPSAQASPAR